VANKRSRCKKERHFYCPHCQARLWRMGSPKHFLFYQNSSELKQNLNISSRKAKILNSHYPVYVDRSAWIEEFFCPHDGPLWLLVTRQSDQQLSLHVPDTTDWKRTTKTIDAERPNPSVSEYSMRMSRSPTLKH
jgi:hypothetical protein